MRRLLILISFWVILAGCHNRQLDLIESYIQEYPDSAITALKEIPAKTLQGSRNKAKYALLTSIALDKNYIDVKSDSIIIVAVNWYERHGNNRHRMLSYYYAGRVAYNAGNYSSAVSYAMKALDNADKIGDSYYEGMTNWLLGDVYYANYNYLKAESHYSEAGKNFVLAGKPRYSIFSDCETAKMRLALGDYTQCDSILNVIWPQIEPDDNGLLSTYYSLKLRSSSLQYKDSEAIFNFRNWEALPVKSDQLVVYGEIAQSFFRTGDAYAAKQYLEKAYSCASDGQKPLVSSFYGRVLYADGKYKQAIDSLSIGYDYQNQIAYAQFANSVDEALADFYNQETSQKVNQIRTRMSILISVLAAILIAAMIIFWFKHLEYKEKLNSAKQDIAFVSQINAESLKRFNKYLQIRQNMIDDIVAGYGDEKGPRGRAGIVYDIVDDKIESLKAGGEGFKKLVKDLNECFDGIVKKLKDLYPDISREDYRILVYYIAGFSQETVSILTGIPVQRLYNIKRNWVEKFKRLDTPDADLILVRMNSAKYS